MARTNTTSSRTRLEETTARFHALMTQQKAEHHRVYRKALEDKARRIGVPVPPPTTPLSDVGVRV